MPAHVENSATASAVRNPQLRAGDSLGYQINLTARLFARALAALVEPLGLAPGQFPVLLALWEREGRTQGELCRIVQVEQPTMANTLARMERDGLIRRESDPLDRRRTAIHLTARGRAMEAPAVSAACAINAQALEGLSAQEQAELWRMLRAVASNLGQHLPNAAMQKEAT